MEVDPIAFLVIVLVGGIPAFIATLAWIYLRRLARENKISDDGRTIARTASIVTWAGTAFLWGKFAFTIYAPNSAVFTSERDQASVFIGLGVALIGVVCSVASPKQVRGILIVANLLATITWMMALGHAGF